MTPSTRSRWLVLALAMPLPFLAASAGSAGWAQFRGADRSGVSKETGLPLEWGAKKNVVWKRELPGPGSSSPIVSGDRIFVTCYSGYGVDRSSPGDPANLTRHLLCLNLSDGEVLWQKSIPATVMPRPICAGLMLPRAPFGAVAPRSVWDRMSSKLTRPDLKPTVLTLAMLLPITSIIT